MDEHTRMKWRDLKPSLALENQIQTATCSFSPRTTNDSDKIREISVCTVQTGFVIQRITWYKAHRACPLITRRDQPEW